MAGGIVPDQKNNLVNRITHNSHVFSRTLRMHGEITGIDRLQSGHMRKPITK